ncbi:hypothetical protein [Halomonas sp. HAL1]|jgi:hypothetical protein|uniref:hypothetical protein n=1 Tax=Halomonadaceae TaxID=28256 RepID=UPI00022D356B|nr:hypothetical protein [Halomonas sp. HAL1]EHA16190.1 hypothetical protein HAL1_07470 [Halomonas sp. HAL1]WKV95127.1 hypothetical protein Q3Y66_20770 [Halomonas sp. HAL1]
MDSSQDKYRAVLIEIKRRTAVVDSFLFGQAHALYVPTTVESVCLQIRKILELVAFSSLIANREIYSAQHKKFAEHWNARLMLKDLERINPGFYPHPIIQNPSKTPGITSDWADRKDDFLTKEQFIKVYEKCGGILHADNPYGTKTDYPYYQEQAKDWRNRMVNLLNAHTIKLINDKNLYLFQMGAKDANPSYNAFAPVE